MADGRWRAINRGREDVADLLRGVVVRLEYPGMNDSVGASLPAEGRQERDHGIQLCHLPFKASIYIST